MLPKRLSVLRRIPRVTHRRAARFRVTILYKEHDNELVNRSVNHVSNRRWSLHYPSEAKRVDIPVQA